MSTEPYPRPRGVYGNPAIPRVSLLVASGALILAILAYPVSIRPAASPLKVGDVAPADIQSPRTVTYTSQILTEQAQNEAADRVQPVYLPMDPNIARRQLDRLKVALVYITTVRQDAYASNAQKENDLGQLTDLHLDSDAAMQILALNDTRWQIVQQESINLLGQVMRNTIRDDTLETERKNSPTLINFTVPDDLATLISKLVEDYIIPNSLFSQAQTDAARATARKNTQAVTRTFLAGETIVQHGQVISSEDWEVLKLLNLIQPAENNKSILPYVGLTILLTIFTGLYFYRRKPPPLAEMRSLGLITIIFLFFLLAARLIIPNRTVLPYLLPLPAFALTIAAVYNIEASLVLSVILSIYASFGISNNPDLTLFYMLSSLCGVLILGRGRRVASFFWAGVGIGGSGSLVILAYRLMEGGTDWIGMATLSGAAFFNGLASSSLTLLLQYIFSQILGRTTAMQLLELSRPDHPLVQLLLHNAPGTYQHTLQVANLAEQAAERIGADALLVRVGAVFHDCGKALNPDFFIENQLPGQVNSHDDIDPVTSAHTVIRHIPDGIHLAQKYRLPGRVQDFIREHHGTLITRYQYTRAVQAAENDHSKVDIEQFRYPGPRPQSRETALLMLADGTEARTRAELPKDESELQQLIKRVIDYCQLEGQLDNTSLTLKDLTQVADSFSNTLRGMHHPRIRYPELNPPTQPVTSDERNVKARKDAPAPKETTRTR